MMLGGKKPLGCVPQVSVPRAGCSSGTAGSSRVESWVWALMLEGPGAVWICFSVQWDGTSPWFWSLVYEVMWS